MQAMSGMKRYVLKITPQTHVRATQGDRILFRIPESRRSEAGTKRVNRLIKYNDYKISLLALAKQQRFKMPDEGAIIRFFLPMPKSWRNPEREANVNRLHRKKPDLDNLLKAFLDSLFTEDKTISHLGEVSKYWVDSEQGWIEILTKQYNPCIIESPYERKVEALC
jgi:Holliday junction resolvase RusA-like endonuclease